VQGQAKQVKNLQLSRKNQEGIKERDKSSSRPIRVHA